MITQTDGISYSQKEYDQQETHWFHHEHPLGKSQHHNLYTKKINNKKEIYILADHKEHKQNQKDSQEWKDHALQLKHN
jgi:hypothetical protein